MVDVEYNKTNAGVNNYFLKQFFLKVEQNKVRENAILNDCIESIQIIVDIY
jgi:hypothetical protein